MGSLLSQASFLRARNASRYFTGHKGEFGMRAIVTLLPSLYLSPFREGKKITRWVDVMVRWLNRMPKHSLIRMKPAKHKMTMANSRVRKGFASGLVQMP